MKVLVLGGYGNFGAVIAGMLSRDDAFEVIVAGRDGERAAALASRIGATSARIDARDPVLAARFAACAPALVISTAGPFQGQDYRVARAALATGADYVDIADGRDFVCGITALDGQARALGRLVVSGASSVPALSSAVVDRYAGEFEVLRAIEVGISASEKMPGLATTQAVLGYCGKSVRQWREGEWVQVPGWQGLRRHEFEDPPMTRWLCDCDVPDLELFPARYPTVRSVRFGAGVELLPVQLGLWLLAGFARVGLVRDVAGWAPRLRRVALALERFGTGRSAMYVLMTGTGLDGRERSRTWELAAAGNQGVNVPCLAAVALARKRSRGELRASGAMPCVGMLTLDEYQQEMKEFGIAPGSFAEDSRGRGRLAP
jgi:saccharopine dehydrogenase-like NADP-dependent oxidoreductase